MVLKEYESMCAEQLGNDFIKIVLAENATIEIHTRVMPGMDQEKRIRDRTPTVAMIRFLISNSADR